MVLVSGSLNVGGSVSVGGTLTYEDVTNIDSIGIITARSNILVGSGITLSPDGDVFVTGISTFSEGIADDITINSVSVGKGANSQSGNTVVGETRLRCLENTTGTNNTVVGTNALTAMTTGSLNTAVGRLDLMLQDHLMSVGEGALELTTGSSDNTKLVQNLYKTPQLDHKTCVGQRALQSNTTGALQYGSGDQAGAKTQLQVIILAVGSDALLSNTTGTRNVVGHQNALHVTTTTNNNVLLVMLP